MPTNTVLPLQTTTLTILHYRYIRVSIHLKYKGFREF
jgi:hypothetical protein